MLFYLFTLLAPLVLAAGSLNQRDLPQNGTSLTPTQFGQYGAKRVQIRYGPFMAPAVSNGNMGMKDFMEPLATMPCSDCLITIIKANLTYPNGSYANANTGMWLHHVGTTTK